MTEPQTPDIRYPDDPVHRRSFLQWLTRGVPVVMLAPGMALPSGCKQVPGTGRTQFAVIPRSQMVSLSDEAFNDIKAKERPCKDAATNKMVQDLGTRLNRHSASAGINFRFNVFENDAVNAFAMPNGQVAVYTGILKHCANEAALATIVGHEIAHVVAQHGNERMSQKLAAGVVLQLAALGLGTADIDPQTQKLAVAALGAGSSVGVLLPFSRKHELEADHLGTLYMAKAGYDPKQAAAFWQGFAKLGGSKPPEYLSTHPADKTRIEQLQANMSEYQVHYQSALEKHGSGRPIPATYRG